MSHLIIEEGQEVGREIAIPAGGMKFGRSPANDLVLEDDAVMLFHGRFFFKSDGALWVTDFGAGEKTTVGGNPIDEYQLAVGDLIEVGDTGFRVISIKVEEATADATLSVPPTAKTTSGEETIDLGFKGSKKVIQEAVGDSGDAAAADKPKSTLSHRMMQLGIAVLVLVVMIIVGPELMKIASATDATVPQQKESIALSYERVEADTANIFRYLVEMDESGTFTITIDDLKNGRHIQKTEQVSEALRMQLASSIDDSGFFDVESDYAGVAAGSYDLYDITVQRNRRYRHIKVLNRDPPRAIKRAVTAIEDFALSEVGIPPAFFKDNAELLRLAEQAFEIASAKYAEREVRYGNLSRAIAHFKEAMLYLEVIEPKPNLFHQAEKGLEKSLREQEIRYKEYMFETDKAIQLGQWTEAERYLRILSELVPERSDPRYDKISAKLLNVEHHLR